MPHPEPDDLRVVDQLRKFRPKTAIEIVRSDQPFFLRTWALVRLFGWIYFDQRAGQRRKIGEPQLRSRNARQLGHIALAHLLDRETARGGDEELRGLISLFQISGGFGAFLDARRGAVGFLSRAHKKEGELNYVRQIVEYLCRHQMSHLDGGTFTLEHAKRFVRELDPTYKLRTIGKYWESNKQAAPYTFGFFAEFSTTVAKAKSVGDLISGLEQLAANREVIKQAVGAAAYATDILQAAARNVRVKDFKGVDRVTPTLATFGHDELALLANIDVHGLPESDVADYRPKTRTRIK